ncbi:MAG TPA: alpha/beta fold hydrolase [Solirubrobacterales bacterium]|nr:alpha/beta fold hydrolase [Solirubrobacterales bacterium]
MATTTLDTVKVNGMTVAYRELGSGPPVLLLHGWPTSSFLWRKVMDPIARANRVVAPDLPGFGASDKPLDAGYDFEFFEATLDGLLEALGIDAAGLAVHDLGGPVGVHWTLNRPGRVTKLALLNTLLYPDFSEAVMAFIKACTEPELREQLTSPAGLEAAMRLGLGDESRLTPEVIAGVREPFGDDDSRRALAAAGIGLQVEGFSEIERNLSSLKIPVRIIYGERDRILPDVSETMARVQRDLPQAEVTALPDCGHFLQEEAPERIGEELARFFAE